MKTLEQELWAELVCEKGEDDCLPYLKDWLLERGLPIQPLNDYVSTFCTSYDAGVKIGFLVRGLEFSDVRATLLGREFKPEVARFIRDARMSFRRWLAKTLGVKVKVSSASQPRWIPKSVQKFLADQFYSRGLADVNDGLNSLPWKFIGENHLGVISCDCILRPSSRPDLVPVEAQTAEVYRNDIPFTRSQTWRAWYCRDCTVWWSTDGRGLEDNPRYYVGI